MSARLVADLGEQMVRDVDGGLRVAYVFLLSCGCRVEMDRCVLLFLENGWTSVNGLRELERTHECQPKMLVGPAKSLTP